MAAKHYETHKNTVAVTCSAFILYFTMTVELGCPQIMGQMVVFSDFLLIIFIVIFQSSKKLSSPVKNSTLLDCMSSDMQNPFWEDCDAV